MRELTFDEIGKVSGGSAAGLTELVDVSYGAAIGGYIGLAGGPFGSLLGAMIGGAVGYTTFHLVYRS